MEYLKILIYGIIEGITEWLPVSSTGHLILFEKLLALPYSEEFMEMFRVVIQLGAILAVVVLYIKKLWPFSTNKKEHYMKKDVWSMWFHVLVATLPAMVLGLAFDDLLDKYLYNYWTVAVMLILYGVFFILIERRHRKPTIRTIADISYKDAFIIGLWQVLAMIPGTSRSGATIVGGLLLGMGRPVAAEFTFFLAIPVMLGASLLKGIKFVAKGAVLAGSEVMALVLGCVVAFVVSLAAIKFLMDFVKKHNFTVFGWYRIALGIVVLGAAFMGF